MEAKTWSHSWIIPGRGKLFTPPYSGVPPPPAYTLWPGGKEGPGSRPRSFPEGGAKQS